MNEMKKWYEKSGAEGESEGSAQRGGGRGCGSPFTMG